jgi:hypothetical protein
MMMAHTVADVAGPPAEQAPEDMAIKAQKWRFAVVMELAGTAHFGGVDVTEQVRE